MTDRDKDKITDMLHTATHRAALENLIANMGHIIAYNATVAKIQKAKFDSLVAEGFTEPQALELAKTIL